MGTTFKELPPLYENVITQRIMNKLGICDKRNMLTLICGETGRGKSLSAQHWCAANPRAIYLQLKATTTLAGLLRQLAAATTGKAKGSIQENADAVEHYLLNNDVVLVIDEANQLLAPPSLSARKKNMEYLRLNIWEQTQTPVALIFTTYTMGEFTHGQLGTFLEQFIGRAQNRLDIPPRLFSVSEIAPIVRQFAPNPSPELIAAAIEIASGIGKLRSLVAYLKIAKELVEENPEKYTFDGDFLLEVQDLYTVGDEWPED
jgi:hypothetical protein